jgi:hypothetical protein
MSKRDHSPSRKASPKEDELLHKQVVARIEERKDICARLHGKHVPSRLWLDKDRFLRFETTLVLVAPLEMDSKTLDLGLDSEQDPMKLLAIIDRFSQEYRVASLSSLKKALEDESVKMLHAEMLLNSIDENWDKLISGKPGVVNMFPVDYSLLQSLDVSVPSYFNSKSFPHKCAISIDLHPSLKLMDAILVALRENAK